MPEPSSLEVENIIVTLKMYKSPDICIIPAKLIQTEGKILRSKINKLINSIWCKEQLPNQWKESIITAVYEKGNKTQCSNCGGISLLSFSYKILFNILLSRLSLYTYRL
jgi:ArsR family metal-binding transcriptional regulator